jgi:hypothetical protein
MSRTGWILLIIAAIVVGGFVLPFLSWLIADEGIAATSGSDFCVSCHSMEPMQAAYLMDVHGGNSAHGMQAYCVDCHLDHSSSAAYFFDKVRTGAHDIWVEYTRDTSLTDWEAKREHRERFSYDSGCKQWHPRLEEATMGSQEAFVPCIPADHPQGQPAHIGTGARRAEPSRVWECDQRDGVYAMPRHRD